jgi:hypothetical protein
MWRRRREGLGVDFGFLLEDPLKRGREEPGRWKDIGSSLAF